MANGSHIDLDKNQASTNKKPKVSPSTQLEVERPIEEINVPPPPPLPYRHDIRRHTPNYIDYILPRKMTY